MAKENYAAYATGKDAAYIKPKLIPNFELMARDDSGGPDWDPYTAAFGDGGYVTGEKAHLSAHGGGDDREGFDTDELSEDSRIEGYQKEAGRKMANPRRPAKSAKEQEE